MQKLFTRLQRRICTLNKTTAARTTTQTYHHHHYQTMSETTQQPTLDKSKFNKTLNLLALSIPQSLSSQFMKVLKGHLFCAKRMKSIVEDPSDNQKRLILFDEQYNRDDLSDLPEEQYTFVKKTLNISDNSDVMKNVVKRQVVVGYDQLTTDQALKSILPENCEIPSAFEQIGHIAHLNLRDILLPYKYIIGQVILDKCPTIKTVVNKVGTIESVYREAQLELIGGEANYNVEVKEHGIRFKLNFSEVYWNSRLSQEHQRVLQYVKKEHTVCDMMAGVGPFAMPAAKKIGCVVHANDLNPKSYEYMKQNAKLNKVESLVNCYNMDGREFVRMLVSKDVKFDHVLMNLPGSAVEFLDVFVNLFPESSYAGKLPMIHVYTFVRGDPRTESESMKEKAKRAVEHYLGVTDPTLINYTDVYDVRDVAPKKGMYCVSFKLPESIGLQQSTTTSGNKRKLEEPASEESEESSTSAKKIKI